MFVYIRMFFQLASVHDFSRNAKHMGEHQFDLMCHTSYDSAPVLQSYKKDISENGIVQFSAFLHTRMAEINQDLKTRKLAALQCVL